ncbi:MAG: dTDP-glucose 4,6-dehydratase [Planctomycetes bacterium]|nr:dTDP-glucose 4,6-dehydratase [Planctomycetota bacterium]MBI3845847.1 dTDP-glucose 4,6-dehydratase [Planctomycetota bacterium]
MRVLVTGGAGFIGSNFIRHFLTAHPDSEVVNFDLLTYAGNLENLRELEHEPRYEFVKGDIADDKSVTNVMRDVDAVVNFAAESHVDRSIHDPRAFIRTNVLGTQVLLTAARERDVSRFVQVSTDEVYGSLGPTGAFTEETPLAPNSPYSASKAAADMLVRAAFHTYRAPVIVTRCSNNYGPFQFPEKLIPLMIANALEGKPLPVYGDGMNVRDWIYVGDHCEAIDRVLEAGRPGEIYNVGASNERPNLDIVRRILSELKKPESLITYVKDRPGHDRRYAIDSTKIQRELGWKPKHSLDDGLRETVQWYLDRRAWWERIRTGEYLAYYKKQYGSDAT